MAEDFALAACLAVQLSPISETGKSICNFTRTTTALLASSKSFSRYCYRICVNMYANTVGGKTVRLMSDLKIRRLSIGNIEL